MADDLRVVIAPLVEKINEQARSSSTKLILPEDPNADDDGDGFIDIDCEEVVGALNLEEHLRRRLRYAGIKALRLTTGEGVGNVWYVAQVDGSMPENPPALTLETATTEALQPRRNRLSKRSPI